MKKITSVLICFIMLFTALSLEVVAAEDLNQIPEVTSVDVDSAGDNTRATGLIYTKGLYLSAEGSKLTITGTMRCSTDTVKCGFKNLTVERRRTSSDSWESCYEFDNIYNDDNVIDISKVVSVNYGYQYRVTGKYYAKKNILMVETISATTATVNL